MAIEALALALCLALGLTLAADRIESPPADGGSARHMRSDETADWHFTLFTDLRIRRPQRVDEGTPARERIILASTLQRPGSVADRAEVSLLAEGWYRLGRIARARGELSRASGDFSRALDLDPSHLKARLALAGVLMQQQLFAQAVPLLRTAIQEEPENVRAMSQLGRALVMTGPEHEKEAALILEAALALAPGDPAVLENIGTLEARLGHHREAVRALRRAAAADPTRAGIWEALAGSLLEVGRGSEALEVARRAVRLRPALPMAQLYLGLALADAGMHEQAEEALRMALVLDPDLPGARKELESVRRARAVSGGTGSETGL